MKITIRLPNARDNNAYISGVKVTREELTNVLDGKPLPDRVIESLMARKRMNKRRKPSLKSYSS